MGSLPEETGENEQIIGAGFVKITKNIEKYWVKMWGGDKQSAYAIIRETTVWSPSFLWWQKNKEEKQ